MQLSTPIERLQSVGPAYQKRLKKLGIKTISDLLFHFPHRYEDFSNVLPISQVSLNQNVCVQGRLIEIKDNRTFRKRMVLTQAIIEDETAALRAVWFNQPYLTGGLKKGDFVYLAGRVLLGDKGVYLSNPVYEKVPDPKLQSSALTHTGRIIPVYPETEGLSSRWLRWIIKSLLAQFRGQVPETIPERIILRHALLPIAEALCQAHFPDSGEMAEKARQRFSFEALFHIGLFVLRERARIACERAAAIPLDLELMQRFVKSLPFQLTGAQKKSVWQILKELEKPRPMNRLLEGDVGSGKTVVALMAALNVSRAGFQTAFMAPTEILAKQHFSQSAELLAGFGLNIGLLTGKQDRFISKKLPKQVIEISRTGLLEKAKKEGLNLLIGTHVLIQDKVKFGRLGLVILDEQHRFGVEQRARLLTPSGLTSGVKLIPHLLSMTATPIPRTLALTIYGDLDLSLIDELPKGRKKIITEVVAPAGRQKTYDFVREQVKNGRQTFVICPRIETQSSKLKSQNRSLKLKTNKSQRALLSWAEVKAVEEEYKKLSVKIFPDLKIAMLHGRLAAKEKERIMQNFKAGKTDILVSTSVIEVGIDVPNAAVMLVEGSERFGLAQLHQFRGRVGRSAHQSWCFFFTDSPSKKTHQRLKALLKCDDGFALAEKDLAIRGPGDFIGTRQWGIPDLAMTALKDIKMVEQTRQAAKEILLEDPGLKKYPFLAQKLKEFGERIHLE